MPKRCPCGKQIPSNRSICVECRQIYGTSDMWPTWLSWMVGDIQREWDYDRHHDELEFFDESDFPYKKVAIVF